MIKLTKSIHDPEATGLRGGTIAEASFENMAEAVKAAAIGDQRRRDGERHRSTTP